MNLEIKIGISLCDLDIYFFLKLNSDNFVWTFAEVISTK